METLSFPGLGLSFELRRVAFSIFGYSIYWYGIIFGFAFIVAALYAIRHVRVFGLDTDRMIDVLLGVIICGLIGARLYYVIFTWDTYKNYPMNIFNVREGGIAIYGGIIGAVLAALLICKLRRVKLLPLLDLFASSLLIAQAIGRWGNFVNMEAFGTNTTAPWGMTGPSIQSYLAYNQAKLSAIGIMVDPSVPVHPTFLYESIWCLAGFVLLTLYLKRRRFDGELTLIYLGWYGLGRAFIEGLRTDSLMLGAIRVSQLVAILCVIASLASLLIVRSKIRRANDPEYLKLYVDTDEGQAILAGTFYKKDEDIKEEKPAGEGGENDSGDSECGSSAEEDSPEDSSSDEPVLSGSEDCGGGDISAQKDD